MNYSTRMPELLCLRCGYMLDAATGLTNETAPKAGDISMCLSCANLAVFLPDLKGLRNLTQEDMEVLKQNQKQWSVIVQARRYIRMRRKMGNWVE